MGKGARLGERTAGGSFIHGPRLVGGGTIWAGHGVQRARPLLDAVKVVAFAALLVALVLALWR